jgi:tRNA(Ile)-lysidine synthase
VRPARPDAALGDDELEHLFKGLAGARLIALAVSGGPDSLALLDCIDRWRRRPGRPNVLVLTVDHRLREGSGREARTVAALARKRGMNAEVLTRRGTPLLRGVEGAARTARYRLLIAAASAAGASHVLTAHHLDDQAETFLMRLQRGAGIFGLAAMRREVRAGRLALVRPFLGVPRARLAATAEAAGLTAVDDPMNADRRYLRARVRLLMPSIAAAGWDAARLAAFAKRMGEAAACVDDAATALLATAVATDALAMARLDPQLFAAAPADVRLRAVIRLLIAIGGEGYPPRFERLSALAGAINGGGAGPLKRTLAGVVVERRGGAFLLYRETGRKGLPSIALRKGFAGRWDHRFAFVAAPDLPGGLTLSGLGEEGRRMVGIRPDKVPAAAVAALPAVWKGSRLVAVPSLGWTAGTVSPVRLTAIVGERLMEPPLFPDFQGDDA